MHNNWEKKRLGFVDCIWDKGDSNKCQLEIPESTICGKENIIIRYGLALHLAMLLRFIIYKTLIISTFIYWKDKVREANVYIKSLICNNSKSIDGIRIHKLKVPYKAISVYLSVYWTLQHVSNFPENWRYKNKQQQQNTLTSWSKYFGRRKQTMNRTKRGNIHQKIMSKKRKN